jgi:hypothetical protein
MSVAPDILVVLATLIVGLSLASLLSAWADRQSPIMVFVSLVIGVSMFIYVHTQQTNGLEWRDVPNSFISVVARVIN